LRDIRAYWVVWYEVELEVAAEAEAEAEAEYEFENKVANKHVVENTWSKQMEPRAQFLYSRDRTCRLAVDSDAGECSSIVGYI
jgi:hypothetical protein